MKTATINFKTDDVTKQKAQTVAEKLGIPLSSLLNAYLHELAATGRVTFSTAEPMTKEMEDVISKAELDIKEGDVSKSFTSLEEMFEHLDSIQ